MNERVRYREKKKKKAGDRMCVIEREKEEIVRVMIDRKINKDLR